MSFVSDLVKYASVILNPLKRQSVKGSRYNGLSIISGSKQSLMGGSGSQATAGNYVTTRTRHVNLTGKLATEVAVVLGAWGPASSTEAPLSTPIVVKTAIEDLSPTTVDTQDQPRQSMITPDGKALVYTAVQLDRRDVLKTVTMARQINAGQVFFCRTGVTVLTNGNNYPRGSCLFGSASSFGLSNGEGSATSDAVGDGAGNTTAVAATAAYSEVAVIGKLADGTIATSVAICGDSETLGTDDAEMGGPNVGGIGYRLFATTPHVYVPCAGERLSHIFSTTGSPVTASFQARSQVVDLATKVYLAYGRNDVENNNSLVLFKALLLVAAKYFMSRGQDVMVPTVLPAPLSTDGWFTSTNQTGQDPTKDALRNSYNAYLNDATATGFVAQANAQMVGYVYPGRAFVLDICAPVETNAAGVLTVGGNCTFGSQSAVVTNGTLTSAGSLTALDSGKTWTVNAWKGYSIYIVSGTGSGQIRCINSNTATQININLAWSVTPDATSVYQVYQAMGFQGVHPHSPLYAMVAADATIQAQVAAFLAA